MRTSIKELKVGLNFGSEIQPVGRLAIRDGIIYFEYAEAPAAVNTPVAIPSKPATFSPNIITIMTNTVLMALIKKLVINGSVDLPAINFRERSVSLLAIKMPSAITKIAARRLGICSTKLFQLS